MKKSSLYLFFMLLLLTNPIFAQLFLPKFSVPVKQILFSSDNEESSPLPFNDGKGIYYNRTYISGQGEKLEITGNDFWVSTQNAKGWQRPYRVLREGEIPDNNILLGITSNGNRMYLLNATIKKKEFSEKLIYVDKVGKNKWSDPVEVIIPGFSIRTGFTHIYVNPEETAILVSMPPDDKSVSEDIFVSLKDSSTNQWGHLINLGQTINTRRHELGSFLSGDTKTLYFSSDGRGGFGASDIFVSYRLSDSWTEWTEPLNLGEPINSKDDESYYVIANSGEVYFVSDRESNVNNIFKAMATGELVFANDSIQGKFVYRGLPVDNVSLVIEDEFGNIIDELMTDEFGNFQFAKSDKLPVNYIIRIKGKGNKEYVGGKIYLTNKEGKPIERFVFTEKGQFISSNKIKERTLYEGFFIYNKEPSANRALVVVDENNFPIDTIYTDDKGRFKYEKLKYDLGVNMSPLDIDEKDFLYVELQLIDKKTNSVYKLVPGTYQELTLKEPIAEKPAGIDPLIQDTPVKDIMKKTESNNSQVIQFGFNSHSVKNSEQVKVSAIMKLLKSDQTLKVKIVGHTDNSGSEEMNKKVGQLRADAVKEFLVKRGIEAGRITTSSEGEMSPKVSNDTEEGRIKNRRAEIIISK